MKAIIKDIQFQNDQLLTPDTWKLVEEFLTSKTDNKILGERLLST